MITTAQAHKSGVIFFFSKSFQTKRLAELRPKMTKIASRGSCLKGEARTINDRNICERRSCMKNNGKSPTFKFVSGEERRPSED